MRRLFAGLLALALCACEGAPTQILVIVDAEPLVRSRARGLSVRIWGRARDQSDFPTGVVHDASDPVAPFSWPRRYAIAPFERDASRLWRFEAAGIDGDESRFVVTRAISGYQEGESLQVVLLLRDTCIGVLCEDDLDSTCDPVTLDCESAVRDVEELEGLTDGGVYDAGAGERCASDAECDDGLECTVDACVSGVCSHVDSDTLCDGAGCTRGRCMSGTCIQEPVDANCDDGITCTIDRCQMDGACMVEPDDGACTAGAGGTCDLVNGCQYDTCVEGVTCVREGCNDATCSGNTCLRPSRCGMGEFCCAGVCETLGCDDANPCTADSCGASGCDNDPAPLDMMGCNDGDPCTVGTVCAGGSCAGGLDCSEQGGECVTGTCAGTMCSFANVPNGTMCSGGSVGCPNRCMGGVCRAQSCGMDAGTPDAGGFMDAGGIDAGGLMDSGGIDSGGLMDSGGFDGGDLCGGSCTPMEDCCMGTCCDVTFGRFCCGMQCCESGDTCSGGVCVPGPGGDGAISLDAGP